MRRKIYGCLIAEIITIVILTVILFALRELKEDNMLLFGYIGAIAIINAYSTACMRIIMMKADDDEGDDDDDDNGSTIDKWFADVEDDDDDDDEPNTDDGITRGADGKL